jgi:serine-type D-Ala-D-Ala carboxypeptidase/endopeptidase (penicillin-binding protein 4)
MSTSGRSPSALTRILIRAAALLVWVVALASPVDAAPIPSRHGSRVPERRGADRRSGERRAGAAVLAPEPAPDDRDRDRILRMQQALREILHASVLSRTRVGMRVMEARTGRLFLDTRGGVLMDPASNQKVLATTTALMRLGADWRFRTELTGPAPNADGVVVGNVYLRGSGDPTVRSGDLDAMAAALVRRGVRSVAGAVIADPRRIGADEPASDGDTLVEGELTDEAAATPEPARGLSPRAPLVVSHGIMLVQVRPGIEGGPAEVTTTPADPTFVIHDRVRTDGRGRSRVTVRLSIAGARVGVDVEGRIAPTRGAIVFRRRVPNPALYAAVLLRASLVSAGIAVRDAARVEPAPASRLGHPPLLLALHESVPLAILLRKINKDSENDYAERVLETAGAEVYGGPATTEKGVRLLREVIGELGLPPRSYVPRNGSGLGHANRITADAMASLLRALYLDPRVGPELLQSLSVGGVDGTTRNRFKGTLAAERVRAKTGTLRGKSCLSGLVGDGPDVLVFSILVEGLRGHSLSAVRGAQVGCVNAMMRYVREAHGGPLPLMSAGGPAAPDFELGDEPEAIEGEASLGPASSPAERASPSPKGPSLGKLAGPREAATTPSRPSQPIPSAPR